jgi:hypothetical protein
VKERIGGAALVFVCALAQSASTQQPADRSVFRTGTNLAIIDAVVVDERGRHVRDLTADDFEVVQQGKTHPVRQALYIPGGTAAPSAVVPPGAEARTPAAAAPAASAGILSRDGGLTSAGLTAEDNPQNRPATPGMGPHRQKSST